MACGYNKVYLVSVYGNENVPMFVYDLAQGHGGTWVPFTASVPRKQFHERRGLDPRSEARRPELRRAGHV